MCSSTILSEARDRSIAVTPTFNTGVIWSPAGPGARAIDEIFANLIRKFSGSIWVSPERERTFQTQV